MTTAPAYSGDARTWLRKKRWLQLGATCIIIAMLAIGWYCLRRSNDANDVFQISSDASEIVRVPRAGEIHFIETWLRPKPILLTFDDGPEDTAIDRRILEILKKHRAHAIWFVNCKHLDPAIDAQAIFHQQVLREIVAAGHLLGNHSYTHPNLVHLDASQPQLLHHEIDDCSAMIKSLSGIQPAYFRPPFGSYTPRVESLIERDGMQMVLWSSNSYDSLLSTFKTQPGLYASYLKTNPAFDIAGDASAGDILLMHDYPNTVDALDAILAGFEKRGFVFVVPSPPNHARHIAGTRNIPD